MGIDAAVLLSLVLVGVGVVVSCAEELTGYAVYRRGGLLAWEVARLRDRRLVEGATARAATALYRGPAHQALLIGTATSAVTAIAIATATRWSPGPAILLTLLGVMLLTSRSYYGMDGSRQMTVVVLVGLAVATLAPTELVAAIGLGFVAAQLVLSYLVSGIAKAASPQWRSGSAIVGVMSTSGYGNPSLYQFLLRHRRAALAACLATIGLEAGFLLVVAAAVPFPVALLGVGVLFHGSIAVAMGLNNFFWAFTSAYPALVFVVTMATT